MITINSRDGHEILTQEEFERKHPGLAAALNAPRPFKEQGEELKRIRKGADMTLREMAKATYRNPKSDDELYPEAVEWAKQHAEDAAIGLYQRFFIPYHSAEQMLKRLVADGHVVPPVAPGGCYQPAPGNGTLLSKRKLDQAYQEMLSEAAARKIMLPIPQHFLQAHRQYAKTKKAWHEQDSHRPMAPEEWREAAISSDIEPHLAQQVWDTYHQPF